MSISRASYVYRPDPPQYSTYFTSSLPPHAELRGGRDYAIGEANRDIDLGVELRQVDQRAEPITTDSSSKRNITTADPVMAESNVRVAVN
ncbi:hypothetical protein AAE478_009332 [Parahypoxylon ruwenzoriense]